MNYRYLDDIAISDAAFEAFGEDLESLFQAAADATVNVMVESLDSINNKTRREVRLTASDIEMLLFEFLQEFIFFKDSENLLLRVSSARILRNETDYTLTAQLFGETIDPARHELNADVKAVTMHRFRVEKSNGGWRATVVLDI